MKRLLAVLLFALAIVLPSQVADAKVAKTGVCHYDADADTYYYIEVPTKQLDKGAGHARHSKDFWPADEGSFVQGVSCPREDDDNENAV